MPSAPSSAAARDPGRLLAALGRTFAQVGIVVDDLDHALHAHEGLGPWSVYTYDRTIVPTLQAGGEPGDFRFRLALNQDNPQLELIQPLDDRSPYARWLDAHGSGVHHLGYLVEDVEATTAAVRRLGFEVIMSGSGHGADGTGAFSYYDTAHAIGYITEAIERPGRRRPPEEIRP